MTTPAPARPTLQVLRIQDVSSNDPARLTERDTLVDYVLNGRHTFTLRIPSPSPTEQEIEAAVREHARNKLHLLDRTLTL